MITTVFWSCTGMDGSSLSFQTAQLISETEKTLIVELPCLGIPRLGFVCGISDPDNNTEAAISYFEQHAGIPWDMLYMQKKHLAVLAANIYAVPDYPLASKIGINTLMSFISMFVHAAENNEYDRLIFECQGQLNSPMTFFSLKEANEIVIPLGKPTEAAYAIASVNRLVRVYKHQAEMVIFAANGNRKMIERAVMSRQEEGEAIQNWTVSAWNGRKITGLLLRKQKERVYIQKEGIREPDTLEEKDGMETWVYQASEMATNNSRRNELSVNL